MGAARTAALLVGAIASGAAAAQQDAGPPTIDCSLGFDGIRAQAQALPGAQAGRWKDFDIVGHSASEPDSWRVEFAFTTPGHGAHPAALLRTLRKQVTGVWTAQSKGCGFGDTGAFAALMADMKAGDTELTNESRDKVEREKREQSPLAPP